MFNVCFRKYPGLKDLGLVVFFFHFALSSLLQQTQTLSQSRAIFPRRARPRALSLTIGWSAAYWLQLVLLFDRSGLYTCDISLSVPTSNAFYTSKSLLQCSHTPMWEYTLPSKDLEKGPSPSSYPSNFSSLLTTRRGPTIYNFASGIHVLFSCPIFRM